MAERSAPTATLESGSQDQNLPRVAGVPVAPQWLRRGVAVLTTTWTQIAGACYVMDNVDEFTDERHDLGAWVHSTNRESSGALHLYCANPDDPETHSRQSQMVVQPDGRPDPLIYGEVRIEVRFDERPTQTVLGVGDAGAVRLFPVGETHAPTVDLDALLEDAIASDFLRIRIDGRRATVTRFDLAEARPCLMRFRSACAEWHAVHGKERSGSGPRRDR